MVAYSVGAIIRRRPMRQRLYDMCAFWESDVAATIVVVWRAIPGDHNWAQHTYNVNDGLVDITLVHQFCNV